MVGARNKQAVRNKPVAHSKPAVHKPGEEAAEVGARIQAEAGVVVRIRAVVVGIRVAGEVRIQEEVVEASLEMPMVLPWHQQASLIH